MAGKAVLIEIVIFVALFVLFKVMTSKKEKPVQSKTDVILAKQAAEEEREKNIAETLEKNSNKLKELAENSLKLKERELNEYQKITQLDESVAFIYDTKELSYEEYLDFLDKQLTEMEVLKDAIADSNNFLIYYCKRLANWCKYIENISKYIQDGLKDKNFDLLQRIPVLLEQTLTYHSAFNKAFEELSQNYHLASTQTNTNSKIDKELGRIKGEIDRLDYIKILVEGELIEAENIAISPKGIFMIEVLSQDVKTGEKLMVDSNGKYSKVAYDGENYFLDYSSHGLDKKINLTQKFINYQLKQRQDQGEDVPHIMVYPIIIVINEQVEIQNKSDIPILHISEILNHILSFKGKEIKAKYLSEIKNVLKEQTKGDRTYEIEDYVQYFTKYNKALHSRYKMMECIYQASMDYCKNIENKSITNALKQFRMIDSLWNSQKKNKASEFSLENAAQTVGHNAVLDMFLKFCIETPIKILSRILNMGSFELENLIKEFYGIISFKEISKETMQTVNMALSELIFMYVDNEALKKYVMKESFQDISLYKYKYFEYM